MIAHKQFQPDARAVAQLSDVHPDLAPVLEDFQALFSRQVGKTNVAEHVIDMGNAPPIKIPPSKSHFTMPTRCMLSWKT